MSIQFIIGVVSFLLTTNTLTLGTSTTSFFHTVSDFSEATFYTTLQQSLPKKNPIPEKVRGAVVPHHGIAGSLIVSLFQHFQQSPPQTIIIVGPNHTNAGSARVITGVYPWHTQFRNVEVDTSLVESLVSQGIATVDDEHLKGEQSIATLVPYIAFLFPEAKIVPLILRSEMNQADAAELGTLLAPLLDQQTLLLASVDFSHYLPKRQAEIHDGKTLQLIRTQDLTSLFQLQSDYLDSPAAIGVLLSAMKQVGAERLDVIHQANSDDFYDQQSDSTTSYFVLTYSYD